MKKLEKKEWYKQEDIKGNKEIIIRNNAFIRSDGCFYLANGYTGKEPSKRLDNSARVIGKEYIGDGFIKKYLRDYPLIFSRQNYYSSEEVIELASCLGIPPNIVEDNIVKNTLEIRNLRKTQSFNKIRTILIQFYGMALFARMENTNSIENVKYFDHSILPNPEWYGAKPTEEQIETMKLLLELNKEDGIETPDVYIKKMTLHYDDSVWHS